MTSFTDNRSRYDARINEIESLARSYVLIGFQEGELTHSQSKNGRLKKPGQSMAQIAVENEFGTDTIPARPFMSTSFQENHMRLVRAIRGEYEKILDGTSTIQRSLNLLGLFGVDIVQAKIRQIHIPPNSPATIARKKSSKPLIDFGQMIQSVRHKVIIR